jgi:tetratricopeptide (TPR) repeat protein
VSNSEKTVLTMTNNKNHNQDDSLRNVEVALTKTEQFLENHLKLVLIVVGSIVVLVLGYLGYQKFIASPKSTEAQEQLFAAQNYFSVDSFDLAINGDGNALGFLDIIDNYGSTSAANLAKYYTGISYLHLGDYTKAIDYLKKFKSDDILVAPLAKSAIGDAYVELKDFKKAESAYKSALGMSENEFTTPTIKNKLALVYEELGQKEKAMAEYEEIIAKYPKSSEIQTIEKSIARLNQQ